MSSPLDPLYDLLGLTGDPPTTVTTPTMTEEQQLMLQWLLPMLQGNIEGGVPQLDYVQAPSEYTSDWAQQAQPALTRALSGQPSTTIDQATTEQYYQDVIRNPAIREYEETTRPGWMAKIGSLHGSHRRGMEQKGYEDLMSGLSSQRAGLYYQDEQARRALAESAAGRQLQGLTAGTAIEKAQQGAWQMQTDAKQNYMGLMLTQAAQQWGMSMDQINQMLTALGLQPVQTDVLPGGEAPIDVNVNV